MSPPAISGWDGGAARHASMDEKKRKRMISNREAARRSRLKKQKLIENLVNEKGQLERLMKENSELCDTISERFVSLQAENRVLMGEKMRQEKHLEYLESVVNSNAGHVRMLSGYKNEVVSGDTLLKQPWKHVHVLGSSQHVLACFLSEKEELDFL